MLIRNALAVAAALAPLASARDAFAHYMAQGLIQSEANSDVADAQYAGFSAFAVNLNENDVGQPWAKESIEYLCNAAEQSQKDGKYFGIFFSMDIRRDQNNVEAFRPLLDKYMNRNCHYKYGGKYFLSTFNGGHTTNMYWSRFFQSLDKKRNEIYFVPDFDDTPGYFGSDANWWNYWAKTVDGLFTWETVWPAAAGEVEVARDNKILAAAVDHQKSYMVGLSSLQYKHWNNNGKPEHRYRRGLDTLPRRMEQILGMPTKAEFAQTMTWNDAGESHYIGTLHSRGVGAFWGYANNEDYRHTAWQPLVKSFNVAFKAGKPASGMRPVNGDAVTGALWHRGFLRGSNCAADPWGRPDNWGWTRDTVNWAVVMPADVAGARVQVYSGGRKIASRALRPGLNYGSAEGMVTGAQYVEVVRDVNGGTQQIYSKTSHVQVTANPKDNICNYNYVVDNLLPGGPN